MKQITLNILKELVDRAVKSGLGDKLVVISDDTEGNGYHGLFYGITSIDDDYKDYISGTISDSTHTSWKEVVLLG